MSDSDVRIRPGILYKTVPTSGMGADWVGPIAAATVRVCDRRLVHCVCWVYHRLMKDAVQQVLDVSAFRLSLQ
jgi:hypothetical protein